MAIRNLKLLLAFTVASLVCYQRADSSRYGPLARTFAESLRDIDQNYIEPVDRRALFEAAMQGMTSRLDPYSEYIPPALYSEVEETLEQEFGGIGIEVGIDPETKQLTITNPIVGTPAYEAGLLAGDRIVAIEGESTTGFALADVVQRLRGPPGEHVRLAVARAGSNEPKVFDIARAVIQVPTVLGDTHNNDLTQNFLLAGSDRLGYVRITSFSERTVDELRTALDWLTKHGARGLILDLRNNPGGLLEEAIEACDLFIDSGIIVTTRGRGGAVQRVYEAHANDGSTELPLVVLVNQYSASASEIVAACLQDHERAIVVGERTWGKGSVQHLLPLEGGRSALKLTMSTYWRPSQKNIHRSENAGPEESWGVMPNPGEEVKVEAEALVALLEERRKRDAVRPGAPAAAGLELPKHDPQLLRAVESLEASLAAEKAAA